MKKYEYKIWREGKWNVEELEGIMNRLGAKGWELVILDHVSVLKREIEEL